MVCVSSSGMFSSRKCFAMSVMIIILALCFFIVFSSFSVIRLVSLYAVVVCLVMMFLRVLCGSSPCCFAKCVVLCCL